MSILVIGLAGMGCGYTLRQSSNSQLVEKGIRKIYLKPIENHSLTAGAENVLYNALVRTINSHQLVRVTDNKAEADAVVLGTIEKADYGTYLTTSVDQLEPSSAAVGNKRIIASHYNATLTASFGLYRYNPKKGIDPKMLWSTGLSRSKVFVGNNRLGVLGTTSALHNESSYQRAIRDLSDELASDFNESMLALF